MERNHTPVQNLGFTARKSLISVKSGKDFSQKAGLSQHLKIHIVERLISVINVADVLVKDQFFQNIKVSTLKRSLLNVYTVGKPSAIVQTSLNINSCTTERSLMNVVNVGKPSGSVQILVSISEFTVKKNFMNVKYVEKPSLSMQDLTNTRESTLERNILNVLYVVELLAEAQNL